MTFLVVNLIGVGFIFIASSLDNSSLKDTFLKVINGDSINWSGAPTTDNNGGDSKVSNQPSERPTPPRQLPTWGQK